MKWNSLIMLIGESTDWKNELQTLLKHVAIPAGGNSNSHTKNKLWINKSSWIIDQLTGGISRDYLLQYESYLKTGLKQ